MIMEASVTEANGKAESDATVELIDRYGLYAEAWQLAEHLGERIKLPDEPTFK